MKILGNIPPALTVALSGGVDSMVLLDFVLNGGRRSVKLAYFHHGTAHAEDALKFVTDLSKTLKIDLTVGRLEEQPPNGVSMEEFWRNARYKFLDSLPGPIALAHHLDDVIETWIFSALHGRPKLIPYRRNACFRPFLTVKKSEILEWAKKNRVPYIEDPSNANANCGYVRNHIRHNIVPEALKVNPGLHKVMRRLVEEKHRNSFGDDVVLKK